MCRSVELAPFGLEAYVVNEVSEGCTSEIPAAGDQRPFPVEPMCIPKHQDCAPHPLCSGPFTISANGSAAPALFLFSLSTGCSSCLMRFPYIVILLLAHKVQDAYILMKPRVG